MQMFPFGGEPLTEEQIAEMKVQQELAQMRHEEISARIKHLIADELSLEQLEVLHALLGHISNSQQSTLLATWYEGQVKGAMAVRDLVLGESGADLS